ncbi:hypothetical protein BO94DRAFT_626886 [Aspergillus sclerotioniger CBS 115572]|uniref:Uncharacterized protein n=1 Tax=Aspergillus sclerotioniger CBS 115572 TaxID=1450535 RepID=A0A317VW88_9EURO|nr:hypothetical protein BO94DRAFT_626886 [Aspergillus sclerotioniger CBS 115572]PWY77287.1 hypothetical protein BO94DRAFT_626886 [Aspergillus sclerotioniger CBS 115572]
MATESLLEYLTREAPPRLPNENILDEPDPLDPKYSFRDIETITSWFEFTYTTIMEQYSSILHTSTIIQNPMPTSPRLIRNESMFRRRFSEYVLPRIRRSLRAAFKNLPAEDSASRQLAEITFDVGSAAYYIDEDDTPGLAFFVPSDSFDSCPNRCPGELKVSWTWKSEWRYSTNPDCVRGYKEGLARLNYYMREHKARYGCILTEAEIVAVRRLEEDGHLAVSDAVDRSAHGEGVLTVCLVLWYMGMLAARSDWEL